MILPTFVEWVILLVIIIIIESIYKAHFPLLAQCAVQTIITPADHYIAFLNGLSSPGSIQCCSLLGAKPLAFEQYLPLSVAGYPFIYYLGGVGKCM